MSRQSSYGTCDNWRRGGEEDKRKMQRKCGMSPERSSVLRSDDEQERQEEIEMREWSCWSEKSEERRERGERKSREVVREEERPRNESE